ncbi:hypothetical protein SO802_013751 [Lithocarpus litseifolius]|uniref:DC1 domain-containing protein n=1 Tax=Lithocarpus litseifolius TaxID=425828 RepID=A0AAW2DAE7_9ROSI
MTLILLQRFSSCPKKNELKLDNNPNLKRYIGNGCKEYGSNGMRYRCEDCNYSLHKNCIFSKPTTTHEILKDFIFKFYEQQPPSELYGKRTKRYCNVCGKHVKVSSTIALKRTWICTLVVATLRKNSKLVWLYNSEFECGEYNFHVSCIMEIIVEELENGTTNILALKNLQLPQRGLKRSYNF